VVSEGFQGSMREREGVPLRYAMLCSATVLDCTILCNATASGFSLDHACISAEPTSPSYFPALGEEEGN
jgi:hypothetical protein